MGKGTKGGGETSSGKRLNDDGIGVVAVPNGYCLWEGIISRFIPRGKVVLLLYKSQQVYKLLTGSDTPFYSMNVFFRRYFFSIKREE